MSRQKGEDFADKLQRFFQTLTADEKKSNEGNYKPGDRCPVCGSGIIDYDGTLNLSCNRCGWSGSSGGACT